MNRLDPTGDKAAPDPTTTVAMMLRVESSYDNSVYLAVCNQTGPNGRGDEFPGGTLVFVPLGRVIAQSSGSAPQIVYADLDPQELEGTRSDTNMYFIPLRRPTLNGEPPARDADILNQPGYQILRGSAGERR